MSYNVCQKCLKMVPYKEPLCKAKIADNIMDFNQEWEGD
jgi:RNA polymerase subunit RPABC4/transcription elongation factor Spt4